jgi:hypothetical protein
MSTRLGYLWLFLKARWSDEPQVVETLLRRFYEDRKYLYPFGHQRSHLHLHNAQPLVYREAEPGAFVFSEGWEKGDRRFGKGTRRCRFGWLADRQGGPFRLTATYGQFHLTLPWVTDGIR